MSEQSAKKSVRLEIITARDPPGKARYEVPRILMVAYEDCIVKEIYSSCMSLV